MLVYQKREILPKIQDRDLGKLEVSGLGSVLETFYDYYYALRGKDSSYLSLFSIFGLEMGGCSSFMSSVLRLSEDMGLP